MYALLLALLASNPQTVRIIVQPSKSFLHSLFRLSTTIRHLDACGDDYLLLTPLKLATSLLHRYIDLIYTPSKGLILE